MRIAFSRVTSPNGIVPTPAGPRRAETEPTVGGTLPPVPALRFRLPVTSEPPLPPVCSAFRTERRLGGRGRTSESSTALATGARRERVWALLMRAVRCRASSERTLERAWVEVRRLRERAFVP